MHRTSARPAPLDFLLPPAHSISDFDRRKDLGPTHLPQLNPVYFEAPIRDGLRTPPADEMGTTYQHPQYSSYASRQDAAYSAGSSRSNYVPPFSGANVHSRTHSALSQPRPASESTVRNEVRESELPYTQPPSPQPSNKSNTLAPPQGMQQRKSNNDLILPNLQIPPSINNSGGSLAEFAAQVVLVLLVSKFNTNSARSPACFGLNLPIPLPKPKNYRHLHQ